MPDETFKITLKERHMILAHRKMSLSATPTIKEVYQKFVAVVKGEGYKTGIKYTARLPLGAVYIYDADGISKEDIEEMLQRVVKLPPIPWDVGAYDTCSIFITNWDMTIEIEVRSKEGIAKVDFGEETIRFKSSWKNYDLEIEL